MSAHFTVSLPTGQAPTGSSLNNFYSNLPGGFVYKLIEQTPAMRDSRECDSGSSDRRKSMTLGEFLEDIVTTAREMDLDIQYMRELQTEDPPMPGKEINQLFIDLYQRLIEKGYYHYPDLVI